MHSNLVRYGHTADVLPEESSGAGIGVSEATSIFQTIAQSGASIRIARSADTNAYATQPVAKLVTVA